MTTDEHYDGEVHGLLAEAFDGDLPAVNLVPGAVDGYRRQRRRTRVLGTAGTALAVAGVVAAGAAVPSWGGGASSVEAAAGGSPGRSVTEAATHPPAVPVPAIPACHAAPFYKFGDFVGVDLYLGDLGTLQAVCDRDVAALKALIPGAVVAPKTETSKFAKQWHDTTPTMPLPQVPGNAPIVDTGSYTIEVDGQAVFAKLDFSTKELAWGGDCYSGKCPPNLTLAKRTPARVFIDPQDAFVVVFSDATHVANVRFGSDDKNARSLLFDAGALFRSDGFADLISADTAQLTRLTHN